MPSIDLRTPVLSAKEGNAGQFFSGKTLSILTGESDLLLALQAPVLFLLPRILYPGVFGRGTRRVGGGRRGSRRVRARAVKARGLELRLKDKNGLDEGFILGLIVNQVTVVSESRLRLLPAIVRISD